MRVSGTSLGVAACTLVASLALAQKIDIKTNRDERFDFKALRTYSWMPSPPARTETAPDAVTDPTMTQEVIGPHIVAAVDRELASRGLTKVHEGQGDIRVVYYAALTLGLNSEQLGSYYQYTTGWAVVVGAAPSITHQVYERGTLVIDFVAPSSNKAVWRGTMATNVNHENTTAKRVARINDAVKRAFEKFPLPRVGKK